MIIGVVGNTYMFFVPDTTTPTILSYTPAISATNIEESTQMIWVFAERVQKGSGSITLTASGTAGSVSTSINVWSSSVEITNSSAFPNRTVIVTIPQGWLVPGNQYEVTWPVGESWLCIESFM